MLLAFALRRATIKKMKVIIGFLKKWVLWNKKASLCKKEKKKKKKKRKKEKSKMTYSGLQITITNYIICAFCGTGP